jgi:excinuclease ABC subunit A
VVVIEHNLDVIKTADWIVDLGPEGGAGGGRIIAEGTPEEIANAAGSYTGQHLKPVLDAVAARKLRAAEAAAPRRAGRGRKASGDLLG